MWIVKFFFLVLIVICFFFYILYLGNFSFVLLAVMCFLPIYMFISLLITKKSVNIFLTVPNKMAAKNQPFNINLNIQNKCIFSVAKAEAVIEYMNAFNGQKNTMEIHFPIQSRNVQRLTFQLKSKFCGVININIAKVTIYDPLRIFKFKVCKNSGDSITILPLSHEINGYINQSETENEDSIFFSQHKSGDDPSEVFDLREYIGGDRINRIHWKLSSKKDEYIVKELSLPIDVSSIIFLELKFNEQSEYTLPFFDTLLESLVSISQFLLQNEKPHTIIKYNKQTGDFERIKINDYDELMNIAYRYIIDYDEGNSESSSLENFLKTNDISDCSSFTYITSELSSENEILLSECVASDNINVIKVTKYAGETESVNKGNSLVNVTAVPVGKITASINEIEL